MSYFLFGLFSIAAGIFIYTKYDKQQMASGISKAIGYGSIYYDKLSKVIFPNANAKIISSNRFGDISEIKYHQDYNEYYLVTDGDNIEVPLYDDSDFENKRSFSKSSDDIILVTARDDNNIEIENMPLDLIDMVKMYSGPKGNFYEDTSVWSEQMKINIKERIVHRLKLTTNISFEILYSDGNIKLI